MVAKQDFKSGFETDSNTDLTKNFLSSLKSRFQIQIWFKIQISDSKPV
jgi:hypothetical protein